jgi:very-short-patch-repair endonuclease
MRGANESKTERARNLRNASTDAEGPYTVDFICREHRLVIEVDGGQHADSERDAIRDKWLVDHNYRVLRFWNNEVSGNFAGVLETIATALAEAPPHPDR